MIFRYRGYLPHLEIPNSTYFVTFRLAGSLPQTLIENWKFERKEIYQRAKSQKREISAYETVRLRFLISTKIEQYLDQGYGDCWLSDPFVATVVRDALKYFDGTRYRLLAWCIMPNHVHVVFTVISHVAAFHSDLVRILHSWKSYSAHQANKILKRAGPFWQDEYYDHLIRSDEELAHYLTYTLENPVKAKLCMSWDEWPWTGCSEDIRQRMMCL